MSKIDECAKAVAEDMGLVGLEPEIKETLERFWPPDIPPGFHLPNCTIDSVTAPSDQWANIEFRTRMNMSSNDKTNEAKSDLIGKLFSKAICAAHGLNDFDVYIVEKEVEPVPY